MPSQKEDPLNSSQKLISALRHCLKNFESGVATLTSDTLTREEKLYVTRNQIPPAHIVFLMFVTLLGYKYTGREEKVAWTIPITYKGTPFLLSHRKFGFLVLTIKETSPKQEVLNEMLLQLKKGTVIADRILQPLFQEQLQKGCFVIANSYGQLTCMYDYFRRKAKQAYNSKPRKPKIQKRNKEGIPISWSSNNPKGRVPRACPWVNE